MRKVVVKGGQNELMSRTPGCKDSETEPSLGALIVGASRLELLTPCL
jgi:hypothetical protein